MCKSVKGAAFFGSSIHVVAAFVFFCWFLFDTVISEMGINLWKCFPPEDDHPKKVNLVVHYLNLLFKFLYYIFLCVTGIYIFRGVERTSPRIIKFALLVFVIVQVISLAIFISVSFTYWEDEDPIEVNVVGASIALVDENNTILTGSGGGGDIGPDLIETNGDMGIGGNNSEELIPVLESPLTSTTTTPGTPEIIFRKVPKIYVETNTRKLSHNQLVGFVFQIFMVGFNAVGSTIYTTVLLFYLMNL